MSSSRERDRLLDIVENSDAAMSYVADVTVEAFEQDRKTIDAVERCLERIIEAAIKIGPERMSRIAPDIELHALLGMGNALRHAYDVVDLRTIYFTVTERLPELTKAARRALAGGD